MPEFIERNHEASKPRSLEEISIEVAELNLRPWDYFKPDNLEKVMAGFFHGDDSSLETATYPPLDNFDFDAMESRLKAILEEIQTHPDVRRSYLPIYENFIQRNIDINNFMREANRYRLAQTPQEREEAAQRFMELNIELYGTPDEDVAAAMAQEIINDTESVIDPKVVQIRQEFIELMPDNLVVGEQKSVRLNLSREAREYVKEFVELLYGPLLAHADELIGQLREEEGIEDEDDLKIGPHAIADIFQTIIDKEFPLEGWKVVIAEGTSIVTLPAKKIIEVGAHRTPASPDKLRALVVHEIGVHMLRSVIGEGSDLIPQQYGFAGYNDAEEGLATILDSVFGEEPPRTGYQHYLTLSLLSQGMEFREVHEIMWRYKVLDEKLQKPKKVMDEEMITKQKTTAFRFMFRSIRGTNGLPWYFMMNYFNGSHKMAPFIEENMGDPEKMTILFLGKIDPTNPDDVRGALDARSRQEEPHELEPLPLAV